MFLAWTSLLEEGGSLLDFDWFSSRATRYISESGGYSATVTRALSYALALHSARSPDNRGWLEDRWKVDAYGGFVRRPRGFFQACTREVI